MCQDIRQPHRTPSGQKPYDKLSGQKTLFLLYLSGQNPPKTKLRSKLPRFHYTYQVIGQKPPMAKPHCQTESPVTSQTPPVLIVVLS